MTVITHVGLKRLACAKRESTVVYAQEVIVEEVAPLAIESEQMGAHSQGT